MARQPPLPPRLVGREAAAAYLSLSPAMFDAMVRDKRMPPPLRLTKGRKAWDVRQLDQAIDELPLDGDDTDTSNDGWDD